MYCQGKSCWQNWHCQVGLKSGGPHIAEILQSFSELVNTTWNQTCLIVLDGTYKYPPLNDRSGQQAARWAAGLLSSCCSVRLMFSCFTDNTITLSMSIFKVNFILKDTSSFVATQQVLFFSQQPQKHSFSPRTQHPWNWSLHVISRQTRPFIKLCTQSAAL